MIALTVILICWGASVLLVAAAFLECVVHERRVREARRERVAAGAFERAVADGSWLPPVPVAERRRAA